METFNNEQKLVLGEDSNINQKSIKLASNKISAVFNSIKLPQKPHRGDIMVAEQWLHSTTKAPSGRHYGSKKYW